MTYGAPPQIPLGLARQYAERMQDSTAHRVKLPPRLAVLASGEGSNLQAILDAVADEALAVQVVVVVSHRTDAPALARAARAGGWPCP